MSEPPGTGELVIGPNQEETMATILIVYGTTEGKCRDLAERIGSRVGAAGHGARVAPVEEASEELVAAADALLLVGSVHVGQHKPALGAFVREHGERTGHVPSAFLSVSLSAADPATRDEAVGYMSAFLAASAWSPTAREIVAGDLRYLKYGLLKRIFMRFMARKKGLPTDTRRDHDFTDYDALDGFVDRFLTVLGDGTAGQAIA